MPLTTLDREATLDFNRRCRRQSSVDLYKMY